MENDNERPNIELADAWMNAARAVRDLDRNLYERLLLKAEFWANPIDWNDEQSKKIISI